MPMTQVAELYQFASSRLDEVLAVGGPEKETFIARPSTFHRRITNFDEIEGWLESQGFSVFFPEQHSFGEQVRRVRESRNIVIQNGSAAHALLLARRKTKACYLSHPAFPIISLLAELLKNLDVDMKIVSGPFETKREPYLDQSDYRIPLDRLKPTIERWMEFASVR
jgi:capsular polysaccharide biosynthesis protein